MSRALVVAPVARNLGAEFSNTVRVPGANNGVKQAWDTLNGDAISALADATLQVYTTLQAIPLALKKYVFQVLRYDDAGCTVNPFLKRGADCTAADFIKTSTGNKAFTAVVAGDRPLEWEFIHRWAGNPQETLGDA